jgi:hypothetical protein
MLTCMFSQHELLPLGHATTPLFGAIHHKARQRSTCGTNQVMSPTLRMMLDGQDHIRNVRHLQKGQ